MKHPQINVIRTLNARAARPSSSTAKWVPVVTLSNSQMVWHAKNHGRVKIAGSEVVADLIRWKTRQAIFRIVDHTDTRCSPHREVSHAWCEVHE